MTIDEIKALPDSALGEAIAERLMGWTRRMETFKTPNRSGGVAFEYEQARWYPPADTLFSGVYQGAPSYSSNMHLAWQVVQRIMRIPESKAEATVAPNTRFMYAFQRAAQELVCSSEAEAARRICEQALAAWESGPLFPEESEARG